MLQAIGFILMAVGCAIILPGRIRAYKKDRSTEVLLELIGSAMLIPAGIILAIAQFV